MRLSLLAQPFIMLLTVTTALLFASQINTQTTIFGYQTKQINLLEDVVSLLEEKEIHATQLPAKNKTVIKDSIAVSVQKIDSSAIVNFKRDSVAALSRFFDALTALKKEKGKVRIAYFGDSMIEGDLISQDLRACLQDSFGGCGVGFVPITSIVAGFRKSIVHSFEGWTTHHLLENMPDNHTLGISGYGFIPAITMDTIEKGNASWVKYTAVRQKYLDKFYQVKLLYGKSESENYTIINGKRYKLDGKSAVNQLTVESDTQSLLASFQCQSAIDIFGFSLESDSGVFVDNFSFRGNSGPAITKVSQSIYSSTDSCLGYDLIILAYGLNAVNPKVTDFSWYERSMLNTIKYIKASFPNASILLLSVGDKSYKKNGVYQTDPSVPILVEVQRKMAEQTGCAFWSLYDAMGGNGSMVNWVEGDTMLANKDYTHFNFKGSNKVGKMLYRKLMDEYKNYKIENKQKEIL